MATNLRLVIVGAGFGGIFTAIFLDNLLKKRKLEADILLLDRNNYQLFTPMLHEVAGGAVEPRHVIYPVRKIGRGKKFSFCKAQVRNIDFEEKKLLTDIGDVGYDILILAPGGVTNFFNVKGAQEFCFEFKTISHAINLRNQILDLFERASCAPIGTERERLLSFVIVGGGCSGVELVSELREFTNFLIRRDYPEIKREEIKFYLMEAGECLIASMTRELGDKARERLQSMGIDVKLESAVTEVGPGKIYFGEDESIEAETIVWLGGVKGSGLNSKLPFTRDRVERIKTDEFLRIPPREDVFILGDAASVVDTKTGSVLPPTAQVAIQEARSVTKNVVNHLSGDDLVPFSFTHRGDLVSLGGHYGVAQIYGLSLIGFPAWLAWRIYYLNKLIGARNKLRVTFDWIIAFLFEPDTARIDITTKKKREVPSKL